MVRVLSGLPKLDPAVTFSNMTKVHLSLIFKLYQHPLIAMNAHDTNLCKSLCILSEKKVKCHTMTTLHSDDASNSKLNPQLQSRNSNFTSLKTKLTKALK